MKLSVIVPSWKNPYLKKHVQGLLDNTGLGDQMEIIVILDGYWADILQFVDEQE